MDDEQNNERSRAEDILLGSLGYSEAANILTVSRTSQGGYCGRASWTDGEEFDFESEGDLEYLEEWALNILEKALSLG